MPEPSASDDAPRTQAGDRDDDGELAQLRRAERLILVIRWVVWAAWVPIVFGADGSGSLATWAVFFGVAAYAALTQLLVRRSHDIRRTAALTMIGDSLGVACMCLATGGVTSDVYPYFYLHLLTTSIRFGVPETAGAFLLDGTLSVGLLLAEPSASVRDLALRLFYLSVIGVVAALLSRDARRHYRRRLAEARQARDQRQELLRQLMGAEEEERKRLAGEIHDRTGHRVFELLHGLERFGERLEATQPGSSAGLERLTAEARALSDELRDVMNRLRPPSIDDFGFVEVARDFLTSLDESLVLSLRIDDAATIARPEVNVMLFRVLQEAVWNARKHAAATRVSVELRAAPPEEVELVVRDDGRGFDAGTPPPRGHYGLLYMKERAEACGGRLRIRSRPGEGTEVRVTAPAV